jgi:hypothetical protein
MPPDRTLSRMFGSIPSVGTRRVEGGRLLEAAIVPVT